MIWLLRLYPRSWRRRYGGEVAELLSQQAPSLRLALDLVAGAIDARVSPQRHLERESERAAQVSVATGTGGVMNALRIGCQPIQLTTQDHLLSAGVLLITTAVLALAGIGLKAALGETLLTEVLLASAFPLSVIASMYNTYLRPYSRTARLVIMGVFSLVILLILTIATLTSRAI
jgi:hypothetical protein